MKIKKILALLLATFTTLSLVGCNGSKGGSAPTTIVTTNDAEKHFVEGTLHKVNVTENNRPFAQKGQTDYKIVAALNDKTLGTALKKASDFIKLHVNQATGALLQSQDDVSTWTAADKYIVLGRADLFEQAGLTMPSDNIGTTGYYIKTVGNSVFIAANASEGYHLGVLALMRAILGYDMLSEDCVIYEKDGTTLPDIEIIEKPDIDYRQESNMLTTVEEYGMGISGDTQLYPAISGATIHNAFEFIPKAQYQRSHPNWYSLDGLQPCFTARGDETEYNAFVEEIAEKMIVELDRDPTYENITFTMEDAPNLCKCDACNEYRVKYGAIVASVINFMNDVDDIVQAYIDENYPGKTFNLLFFAYHESETAPVVKSVDGDYVPRTSYVNAQGETVEIEPMLCNPTVNPLLAPIGAKYTHSFYEDVNGAEAENMIAWKAVATKLYMWLYSTNFQHYLYPYNSWDTEAETMRYLVENDAVYVYYQGQYNQPTPTGFTMLKNYLDSKLQFDCNADYRAIVDKFFKYYYREAADIMRTFFDEVQIRLRYLEQTYSTELSGYIRDEIDQAKYWPQQLLKGWVDDIDEAYTKIEKYKDSDPMLYASLVKHIKQEGIFPRYALCTLHANIYSDAQLLAMRKSFKEDCFELNVTRHEEHVTIDSLFALWGV